MQFVYTYSVAPSIDYCFIVSPVTRRWPVSVFLYVLYLIQLLKEEEEGGALNTGSLLSLSDIIYLIKDAWCVSSVPYIVVWFSRVLRIWQYCYRRRVVVDPQIRKKNAFIYFFAFQFQIIKSDMLLTVQYNIIKTYIRKSAT